MSQPETLVVNFAALQNASGHIEAALTTLHSQLDQLESDAAPLVATWAGEAREAYDVRQARWRRAAADLSTVLRNIKVAVDESAADYQATERRNATLF